ncbi:MAG: hypothetical protein MZV65_44625 [Chromatiales bacterium]|nr:hypothetical protein [Chromatiales bacterium]
MIFVVANLDPHHVQSGWVDLPVEGFELGAEKPFQVHDLLSDARYLWHGPPQLRAARPPGGAGAHLPTPAQGAHRARFRLLPLNREERHRSWEKGDPFRRSRLEWAAVTRPRHAARPALDRRLPAIRHACIAPRLPAMKGEHGTGAGRLPPPWLGFSWAEGGARASAVPVRSPAACRASPAARRPASAARPRVSAARRRASAVRRRASAAPRCGAVSSFSWVSCFFCSSFACATWRRRSVLRRDEQGHQLPPRRFRRRGAAQRVFEEADETGVITERGIRYRQQQHQLEARVLRLVAIEDLVDAR